MTVDAPVVKIVKHCVTVSKLFSMVRLNLQDRQADRQTGRQTGRQTDRQTDRQTQREVVQLSYRNGRSQLTRRVRRGIQ